MRVWLDDVRPMPKGFDYWAKEAGFLKLLLIFGIVKYISFDHDLGSTDNKNTGYAVALEIERLAHEGLIPPIKWHIHSANPVGRMKY